MQWIMMDSDTGDIIERGDEDWIKHRQRQEIRSSEDNGGTPPCRIAIMPESDARRAQKEYARRMSGNPPRDLTR
jgi:hypothetical protein